MMGREINFFGMTEIVCMYRPTSFPLEIRSHFGLVHRYFLL